MPMRNPVVTRKKNTLQRNNKVGTISPFANSEYVKGHGDNRHIRSRDRTGKKTKASCACSVNVHHATGRSAHFTHTQGLRNARLRMVE